jgi:hypothetical protein
MDGDLRYDIVRDHIRQRHDLASRERSARLRLTTPASPDQPGWTSGIVSVVGSLSRRAARRPLTS